MGDGVAMVPPPPWNVCTFCGDWIEKPGGDVQFWDGETVECQSCGVEHGVCIIEGVTPVLCRFGLLHHESAETEEGERLEELLTTIELRNFLFPVAAEVVEGVPGCTFRFHYMLPERDTGKVREFVVPVGMDWSTADDQVLKVVFGVLDYQVRHELKEAWHVDGVRVHEEHPQLRAIETAEKQESS